MIKKLAIITLCIITCIVNTACVNNDKDNYTIKDIKIFKDTPAWELILAVKKEKINKIDKILKKNPELIDYQEPHFGVTPLLWSVGMDKYDSAKKLLEYGADPDLGTLTYGRTPLLQASSYSWVDTKASKDPKFVKLLLEYGADPNKSYIGFIGPDSQTPMEPGTTPLMNSIGSSIEKMKMLIEYGADIDQESHSLTTAAICALFDGRDPNYAYYLIVEKKANVSKPFLSSMIMTGDDPNKKFYSVELLRTWFFRLDSENYKVKMKIVNEFEARGIDYWNTKVPDNMIKRLKILYPDTWEYVLERY